MKSYHLQYTPANCLLAFACDIDGCGRHFSVVSNLRRHKKVHKGDGQSQISDDED